MTASRIILITGGSRGLGRASALALADAGDDLIITYRADPTDAEAVVREIEERGRRAIALALDTTASETFGDFARAVRVALGDWDRDGLDGLVNNAGFSGMTPFGAIQRAEIDSLVAVHFTGVVLFTQELAPLIKDSGRILNISTGLTRNPANPAYSVYAAVKAAVETWTLYLAKELGPRGIAVNVLAPGATATDFGGGALRDNENYRNAILSTVSMGRIGEASDIGAAVASILDRRMSWVTAQRIEASGGQRL
jgi:NAD(P)-dependent dehydrogenase (short-subunit alcohol dehydrogenase family)